jgi:hypothetical protein
MWTPAILGLAAASLTAVASAQERPPSPAPPERPADRTDPSGTGRTCPPPTTSSEVVLPDGTRVKMNTADCVEAGPRKQ